MKKAAFVLALVMLLGCVSGCGAAEGEASVQSVSMICGLGSVGLADRFAGIVSPLGETTIKKNDAMTIDTIKVKVGDSVKKGDKIAEVLIGKASVEVTAPADGTIHIKAEESEIVSGDDVIAEIA